MGERIPAVRPDEHYAELYATRKKIADADAAALEDAIAACGRGAEAYGRHLIVDKLGQLPDRVIYCCRRPTHTGWQPDGEFPGWDERLGPDNHPGYEVKGVVSYPFRFSFSIGVMSDYRPQTPEQLKQAAERRRRAAVAKVEAQAEAEAEMLRADAERRPTLFAWAGLSG